MLYSDETNSRYNKEGILISQRDELLNMVQAEQIFPDSTLSPTGQGRGLVIAKNGFMRLAASLVEDLV